ncbi:MAG: NAD-dependent epimerase/dehydratase family protein [Planctomycetota bacterium]
MDEFRNKSVLITGGLGFIGSNLAIKLVNAGAEVTVIDNMLDNHGGNIFNIEPVKDKIHTNFGDINSESVMNHVVRGKDYIFHLAGQVSHVLSLSDPFPDIDINIKGTAILAEACRKFNKDAVIIYSGTRGAYGSCVKLPVSEDAPTNPKGIHEIANLTAEKILKVYNDIHGVRSVVLRLTNIYGPRAQMLHHHYGVVNWFIRLAIDDQTIKVFGDGSILRDVLYVDDCIDAMLKCAVCEQGHGEIFNVGVDRPISFRELVEKIIKAAGCGSWEFAPFSAERKAQDPGDFYSDIAKIKKYTGWTPCTSVEDGLAKTIEYYRKYKQFYWGRTI